MERRSTLKRRSTWHWLGALGAVLVPAVVTAALTLPNTFTAGTVIKSADMNANFAAVVTHANGVDTSITALQTQMAALQAAAPIAYAKNQRGVRRGVRRRRHDRCHDDGDGFLLHHHVHGDLPGDDHGRQAGRPGDGRVGFIGRDERHRQLGDDDQHLALGLRLRRPSAPPERARARSRTTRSS